MAVGPLRVATIILTRLIPLGRFQDAMAKTSPHNHGRSGTTRTFTRKNVLGAKRPLSELSESSGPRVKQRLCRNPRGIYPNEFLGQNFHLVSAFWRFPTNLG